MSGEKRPEVAEWPEAHAMLSSDVVRPAAERDRHARTHLVMPRDHSFRGRHAQLPFVKLTIEGVSWWVPTWAHAAALASPLEFVVAAYAVDEEHGRDATHFCRIAQRQGESQ